MEKKTAIITGASSGIGKAICTTLLDNGFSVVAGGRTINSVFNPTENLALSNLDLLAPETSQALLSKALTSFGRCDMVFVNAGMIESNDIEHIDIDKVCQMARLKVEMSFRLIYTVLKHFKKVGTGHVFITSSVMGTKTRENSGAYAGCNYALEALAESLRMELTNTDIKITCIEPGLVETDLHRDWDVKPKELLGISNALEPQDIADAVIEVLNKPSHVRVPRIMILPKGHRI